MTNEERIESLFLLQETYAEFTDFMTDVWEELLGVPPTDIQYDMGHYLQYGETGDGGDLLLMAQRGQAKTTVMGAFGVWSLIKNPATRVLIFSAGGKMSMQISGWMIKIIMTMDTLECLRPSRNKEAGLKSREAVDGFDVHLLLKGADKSPSIACLGIESNMQGFRADLLIADDVESSKNSKTEVMRDSLRQLCKDFSSLCSKGRIIYLGTPQSVDTIYNMLPALGFSVRIWTGRYPTVEQLANYGDFLAPIIAKRIAENPSLQIGGGPDGLSGKPVDPVMFGEEELTKKEIMQGPAYFQLQQMLNAKLADEDRYPLKLRNLIVAPLDAKQAAGEFVWGPDRKLAVPLAAGFNLSDKFYRAAHIHTEYFPYQKIIMAVDPAGGGQNADETGYAVLAYMNSYVFALAWGGIPGGHDEEKMLRLARIAQKWGATTAVVEKNYGNGVYAMLIQSALRTVGHTCTVVDSQSSGQKELRIIDSLEPLMARHRLILNEAIIAEEWELCQKYAVARRQTYSAVWQMARITREKRALTHDDRLDALAIGVRYMVENLCQNPDDMLASEMRRKEIEFWKNPLHLPDYILRNYDNTDFNLVRRMVAGSGALGSAEALRSRRGTQSTKANRPRVYERRR